MAFSRDSAGGTFANSKLLQFFGLPSDRAESVILDQVVSEERICFFIYIFVKLMWHAD